MTNPTKEREEERAIVRYFTLPDATLEEMAEKLEHCSREMWAHAKSQQGDARKWCLRVATRFPRYARVLRDHFNTTKGK